MVTTTTGFAKFRNLKDGSDLTCQYFISDVVGGKLTWNQQGAAVAGSDSTLQFSDPVQLVDLATVTGPTVMAGWNWYLHRSSLWHWRRKSRRPGRGERLWRRRRVN